MAVIKSTVNTSQALTVTSLSSLASATYCASNSLIHTTNSPLDVLVEVSIATTNTPTSNKQIVVFCQSSVDGTNWSSGPISGTTTTDEPDLYYVGSLPMNSATTTHRRIFSLAAAYGGTLPAQSRLIFKNDMGVAVTSASVITAEVWGIAI